MKQQSSRETIQTESRFIIYYSMLYGCIPYILRRRVDWFVRLSRDMRVISYHLLLVLGLRVISTKSVRVELRGMIHMYMCFRAEGTTYIRMMLDR